MAVFMAKLNSLIPTHADDTSTTYLIYRPHWDASHRPRGGTTAVGRRHSVPERQTEWTRPHGEEFDFSMPCTPCVRDVVRVPTTFAHDPPNR